MTDEELLKAVQSGAVCAAMGGHKWGFGQGISSDQSEAPQYRVCNLCHRRETLKVTKVWEPNND